MVQDILARVFCSTPEALSILEAPLDGCADRTSTGLQRDAGIFRFLFLGAVSHGQALLSLKILTYTYIYIIHFLWFKLFETNHPDSPSFFLVAVWNLQEYDPLE